MCGDKPQTYNGACSSLSFANNTWTAMFDEYWLWWQFVSHANNQWPWATILNAKKWGYIACMEMLYCCDPNPHSFLSGEYDMKNLSFHVVLMQYLDDYIWAQSNWQKIYATKKLEVPYPDFWGLHHYTIEVRLVKK